MNQNISAWVGCLILAAGAALPPASPAQQARDDRPRANGGNSMARNRASDRTTFERNSAVGRISRTSDDSGEDDPLRHYNARDAANEERTESYESPTAEPVRAQPSPRVRRNYFPGMRGGQSPNRNIPGHRCVPGRHQFLGAGR